MHRGSQIKRGQARSLKVSQTSFYQCILYWGFTFKCYAQFSSLKITDLVIWLEWNSSWNLRYYRQAGARSSQSFLQRFSLSIHQILTLLPQSRPSLYHKTVLNNSNSVNTENMVCGKGSEADPRLYIFRLVPSLQELSEALIHPCALWEGWGIPHSALVYQCSHLLTEHLVGICVQEIHFEDFPGGPVVKNLPANAGDMGSVPGLGRFHMPRDS